MRTIFILKGIPASGKSTWIKENKLEHYTISSDDIRLLFHCPVYNVYGNETISQSLDKQVWNFIFSLLEEKMQRGETVFVDATHYNNKSLTKYKDLIKKYKYRAYIVDFMLPDLTLDEILCRNSHREMLKRVPDEVIEKMWKVIQEQEKPSSVFKIIRPNDVNNIINNDIKYDFNKWRNIYVFGDIHGCVEPLKDWFDNKPYSTNDYYIFVGDLLDRGIQNAETVEFMYNLLVKSDENNAHNVLILEGNHERHIRNWVNDIDRYSDEFRSNTLPQIEHLKDKVKYIVQRLGQMAYFTKNNKIFFVSHGGLSHLPNGLTPTEELIKGTGGYGELTYVYDSWMNKTPSNCVMIHGHRNLTMLPIKVRDRIYNLNDEVEWGGCLRILDINSDGNIYGYMIKNNVFTERKRLSSKEAAFVSDNEFVNQLNNSSLINKKCLKDGIVSFNFSKEAFYDKQWNELTVKARGLFIDSMDSSIVCRSYNKFWTIDERPETKIETLKHTLQYPVYAYHKENGFLGLVSYDKRNNKLFIASKSTNEGEYAGYVREEWERLSENTRELLTAFLKGNDYTLVFEVIKVKEDPHIIKYENDGLYLLDVVKNTFDFEKLPYNELCNFAKMYGLRCKTLDYVFESGDAIDKFMDRVEMNPNDYLHEGWVFEDSKGYMFKYKTKYYRYWKQMRSIKDKIVAGKELNGLYLNESEKRVVEKMKNIPIDILSEMSIIDVREYIERNN